MIVDVVITVATMRNDDEGKPYPVTQVYRYEMNEVQVHYVLKEAASRSISGSMMRNKPESSNWKDDAEELVEPGV